MILDPALFWQVFGSYENRPIKLDDWQIRFLQDHSRFRCAEKAPQIGWSWLLAAEATWEAIVFGGSTSSFVSVDQKEASNKIIYCKRLYYELPEEFQVWVPVEKDSVEEFAIGDHAINQSRLLSIPATAALRGRHTNVYLDEMDFYKDGGAAMHRVALGRVQRGGHLTYGSTCWGTNTQLDKLMSGEERNFSRSRLPWPVIEREDELEAVMLSKQELAEDEFAEEYECVRGGGSDLFSPELLRRQQHSDPMLLPEELMPYPQQIIGYDVGTSDHPSVISVLERQSDGVWRQTCLAELRRMALPKQYDFLNDLLTKLETAKIAIDVRGIGMHIGQSLQAKFKKRIIPIQAGGHPEGLPSQEKAEFVTEFRRALESEEVELGIDREQSVQFQRTKVFSGGKVEQRGSAKKSHYDKAWATMYAWYGTRLQAKRSVYERRGLRLITSGRKR